MLGLKVTRSMNAPLLRDLNDRARQGNPVRIGIVGTGYFGSGIVGRAERIPGLQPVVAANRTLEKAVAALRSAGVSAADITLAEEPSAAEAALLAGQRVVTSNLALPAQVSAVDVVMETTGDVAVGARVAADAIAHGKHLVAANPETQATVGPLLKALADEAGVVYSDVDGDEPGILTDLVRYARGIGFPPVLAGNCKGVLKRYATPVTQAEFAAAHGLQPWIATAAADGTKLNCEMAVVANATGMPPASPGMTGVATSLETAVADLDRAGLLSQGPIVEYVFGIPNGVFVIFRADNEPAFQRDFEYLKMGRGPHYLLHRPHVLVHYTAPLSAAAAALYGCATVAPAGAPVAEVIAYTKRPLPAGTSLDGIGGFDCYGLVHRRDQAAGLLPIGLGRGATLLADLPQDAPIPLTGVDLSDVDPILLDLRRRQEGLFEMGTLPARGIAAAR